MFGFCLVCTFKPEERLDEMRNGVALRSATAVAIAGMFFAGGGGSRLLLRPLKPRLLLLP